MIRVALADDQALFRAGVRMLVESQPDLEFAGEAAEGRAAIELVAASRPDVLVMDVRMPGMDGIAATEAIVGRGEPSPRILILTTFDLDENAARAIQAGASGFLLKDAEPELLLAAIRTVHNGNEVIAASATRRLLSGLTRTRTPQRPAALDELTEREREIFSLAARGLSNAEIASAEFLSEATVKTHVSRILGKLGLRDRVQLVVFAYEHGLVRDEG